MDVKKRKKLVEEHEEIKDGNERDERKKARTGKTKAKQVNSMNARGGGGTEKIKGKPTIGFQGKCILNPKGEAKYAARSTRSSA